MRLLGRGIRTGLSRSVAVPPFLAAMIFSRSVLSAIAECQYCKGLSRDSRITVCDVVSEAN